MYGGIVEYVFSAGYAEKTRALLKGLGAELGNFQQFLACLKAPVFLSECNDILSNGPAQAGYMGEEGYGRGIQIHTHAVNAAFNHSAKSCIQLSGRHVVLVLAYANGFRVDFTSSARGSCSLLAMETALRRNVKVRNSLAANFEAE